MQNYQKPDLIQKCSNDCINDGTNILGEHSDLLHFWKTENSVSIITELTHKCSACRKRVTCEVSFLDNPLFLFIEANSHFKINELPQTIKINNKIFKFLCAIIYKPENLHFVSIFEINNNKYMVDDLVKNQVLLLQTNASANEKYFLRNISSALYYLL